MNKEMLVKFNEMAKIFNNNLKKIKRELNSLQIAEMYKKYQPEDDGHLAKILMLRGVEL